MPDPLNPLLAHLDAFVSFVRQRTGDADLAAEVVQDALRKALSNQGDLRESERLLPWFWRILRNTMADALSHRGQTSQLPEDIAAAPVEEQQAVCACLTDAIARLPDRERQAILRVDRNRPVNPGRRELSG